MSSEPTLGRANQPNSAAWEQHKETFRQLYLIQSRTLREVMEIMREEHGFIATSRMYKYKFQQWNFRKTITKDKIRLYKAGDVAARPPIILLRFDGLQLGSQRSETRFDPRLLTRSPDIDALSPDFRKSRVSGPSHTSVLRPPDLPSDIDTADEAADKAGDGHLAHPGEPRIRFSALLARQRSVCIAAGLHHTISRDKTAGVDHKRCEAMAMLGSRQTKSFRR